MPWSAVLHDVVVPVLQTVFGPIIGAGIAFASMRRSDKERLGAAIVWDWGNADYRRDQEEPFVHILNRSNGAVLITSAAARHGLLVKSRFEEHPFACHDEPNFDFPYRIEPGQSRAFWLDKMTYRRMSELAPWYAKLAGLVHIPYLWFEARTIAGTCIRISAADATPFRNRPSWLER